MKHALPSNYLLTTMPMSVLHGTCIGIERWCAQNEKERPTLLDLDLARRTRKKTNKRGSRR